MTRSSPDSLRLHRRSTGSALNQNGRVVWIQTARPFDFLPLSAENPAMKTLILMRHAEANSPGPGQSDFARALTDAGRIMASQTAEVLRESVSAIESILSSSALRTQETALLVHRAFPNAQISFCTELYQAHDHGYLSLLRSTGDESDLTRILIGHNPTIAHLMCRFAGQSLSVPPATAAVIELQIDQWSELRCEPPQNASRLVAMVRDGRRVS